MSTRGKILIVDDDADFVKSTGDLLAAHGYEVVAAPDGAAGLAKARQERPDLMVLDVMMATQTEGFEVARKIPEAAELRKMPVLLVTGIRNAMKLGYRLEPDETWLPVNRIMEKPIEPGAFIAAIGELLRKRDRLDMKAGGGKTVREILASKEPVLHTVTPDATVFEAIQQMDKHCVGALLVVRGAELAGIISERDYARKVILEGRSSKSTLVREIMSAKVVYVTPAQSMEECMALMTHKRIRHLPVLDNGKLVGMVSIGDLVRATIAEKNFLIEQMGKYITGG
jgi:CBS domain-containing protein/CheY-like chemotaxis protein